MTHGMSARHLLKGQLRWMREAGFDVAVAASPGVDLDAVADEQRVQVFPIPMQREIAPTADLRALAGLYRLMGCWKPHIVNASTPKAGLLGMLAARATSVPVRVYVVRGLRLETSTGCGRMVLAAMERAAAESAHRILTVSASLARRYCELGLAPRRKVTTLVCGSSNGVDAAHFADGPAHESAALRGRLGIPPSAPVVGFVGRLTRDKGIVELVAAFERIRAAGSDARLLLVGDFEVGDAVPASIAERICSDAAIVQAGFVNDAAPYYRVMDVLAFPSRREGFPNVLLEAAAAGVPVVACRATGTVDAVVDGRTGTLVAIGDVAALAAALRRYLGDVELRHAHGLAGQRRVREQFQPERLYRTLLGEYESLLARRGIIASLGAGICETRHCNGFAPPHGAAE